MNGDKAVAEPNRQFVGRMRCMFDPVSRLVDGLLHVHDNAIRGNTDVAFGRAILSRPTPYVAEHALVQFAQKIPIKDIAPPAVGPAKSRSDVDLLGFI